MAQLFAAAVGAIKGATLGQVLAAGGSVVSAAGSIASGNAQKASADFQARQLEAQATAERGGGQDIGLLGDIEEEGTYRQMLATWGGEERAKGRQAQAAAARMEGKAYKRAGFLAGAKTLMAGGSSFMERYG
jgi:hypothetical protein